MGDLSGLTDFLYLHDNELIALPQSLRQLAKLRYLNLSKNDSRLPRGCHSHETLLELRMTDNRLTLFPGSLGRLSHLRELHLRNNKLMSLPDSIGLLSEVRKLDVSFQSVVHPERIKELELPLRHGYLLDMHGS